ncbi:MAG: tRNA (N(6)-L-threonylcarbamoyladenosine(37)-C(2))-methylthiotransferase MtaB, partial [Dehalococcoidia bacterium]|nr:tRNA (N(6)-L-threonylcarbamoyladenosine(37)-C(2))-methylthiotransferase MtaB [Dehalococcoidia bacterium]
MTISVALATQGCKVNQAEAEELRQRLEASGRLVTDFSEAAHVYVIRTCTVTHLADRKARNLVQRACRSNPEALVLVTGCYARRASQELATSPQVQVIPDGTPEDLARYLEDLPIEPRPLTGVINHAPAPRRARALVKAQDGCDQHCTYCIVPLVRGRSRSLPIEEVVRRVRELAAAGYREVVLTGVNLTYYGQEWGGSLGELLDHVLEAGPERLRLSSLQPQAITDGLLLRWRDKRLCRHFHLALQSGSDAVLRRMGRRHTVAEYRAAVERIREMVPGASITTDIMVGFPGESQEEFEESYNFCRETGFTRMHIFQYSPRPGTAAARLPGAVPVRTKASRSRQMLALAAQEARAFRERFLGSTIDVLFEEEVKGRPGHWRGFTDNYLEVEVVSERALANSLLPVSLRGL